MADRDARPDISQLVREHHAPLYRYAYRLTGTEPDAEDLTQQTFLLAQSNLAQLREAAKARGWLFAILRNCYRKMYSKKSPVSATRVDVNMEHVPDPAPKAEEIDQERLQQAIDELSDDFKLVLTMFYFEDCSYREIAEQLELPLGTVMSRLSRAKSHLRARLFEPELHGARGRRDA